MGLTCLLFFKNHGEKLHGAGIEGGLEALTVIQAIGPQ